MWTGPGSAVTGAPATESRRTLPKGNAAFDTSVLDIFCKSSREAGPCKLSIA